MRGRHEGTPSGAAGMPSGGPVLDVDQAIDKARRQCEAGRFSPALALLNPFPSAHPDSHDLSTPGPAHCSPGAETGRRIACSPGLRQAGFQHAGLTAKLGWTSLAAGDLAAADASMREAVASAPGDWQSRYGLGAALRGTDPRAAKAELPRRSRHRPTTSTA